MRNILTVLKKELLRVFKDKRLIISLVLPGLMIYVLYSIMGGAMSSAGQEDRDARYNILSIGMPAAEVRSVLESEGFEINAEITAVDSVTDERKEQLKTGEIDLIVVFPENFESGVASGTKPAVTVYYNPSEARSGYAYEKVMTGLEIFRQEIMFEKYGDTSVFTQNVEQVLDEKTAMGGIFAMLIPFLIITFLFSGCMAVAPDAIAGEKERGTIATILITPIKRSQLALGKVFALGILASISALSSFIGLMLSLPKLMGGADIANPYGAGEYVMILLVLLATVLLIVGVMSVISSFAKTVKEATMLITPFMFLSMLIGLGNLLGGGAATNAFIYLIPLYNSVQAITSILTFAVSPLNLILAIVSNLVYLAACVFALTKLFNNEKVMFSK